MSQLRRVFQLLMMFEFLGAPKITSNALYEVWLTKGHGVVALTFSRRQ